MEPLCSQHEAAEQMQGHQACRLEAPSRAEGPPPATPSLEPTAGPTQAPTGHRQQPGSHTASSLRARAQQPPPAKHSKRIEAEQAAEPSQPTRGKGKAKGKAAKAKPAPQPGRWVDRDCNAALNMQRIGESKWRPLELCYWPEQGKLPAKGKEYPGLGYKRETCGLLLVDMIHNQSGSESESETESESEFGSEFEVEFGSEFEVVQPAARQGDRDANQGCA
ncbi:hypothetical protein QJQ45_009678 [Haematococcus lacustris]|nr:hypothetical protein QJQ45_009678 [Haematococcus lacustris]